MTDTKKQPAVGIDLGTTFSAVAFLDSAGRPETIRNSEGDLTTPSAVFFDHNRPIVGIEAVEAGLLEPDRLAQFAKRDVGEDYYEKKIRGKHLPAEVIQALILRKLKDDAKLKLGEIHEAVITVPAFFNEPCRKATQDAGRLAGLRVLDIINEPTAAAITYGVQHGFLGADGTSDIVETVLVYDLGGGTFDVTVMEIKKGNFNTIATAGDVYLGGLDWDSRIVDFIAESFEAEHGIDPRHDPQIAQELLRKANQTKHALTQRESVTIAFAYDGKRLRTQISQQEFSDRCDDLVERTLMTVRLVLDDAEVDWSILTRLILVGGSTRMPMIRDELERLSGMELDRSLSPDEAVSHGAALYAGMLMAGKNDKSGISVSNVNSHDLGVLAVDPSSGKPRRQIMIPRNSRLPAQKMVRFRTHSDNQANVKIEIVEGGDARGINATKIGKCIVEDIPRGTPKGTNVDVRFDYTPNGRLTVHASLPEIDRKISMTLDRASGLTDDEIKTWATRFDQGFSDAMLADLPAMDGDTDSELSEVSVNELSSDESVPREVGTATVAESNPDALDFSNLASSSPSPSSVAAILNMTAPAGYDTPASPQSTSKPVESTSRSDGARSIKIELSNQVKQVPKLSAADAKALPNVLGSTPKSVSEKPDLDLDPADESNSGTTDKNDFAMLASLAGQATQKPSSSQAGIPVIVTGMPSVSTTQKGADAASKKAKPKKSGGLFSRKQK